MKLISLLIFFPMFLRAQKDSLLSVKGTTIIVAFPKDSIILAADTRGIQKTIGGYRYDTLQKIRSTKNYVFGFAGLEALQNIKQQEVFNVFNLFERCIKNTSTLKNAFTRFQNKLNSELKYLLSSYNGNVSDLSINPDDSSFLATIIFFRTKGSIEILTGKYFVKSHDNKLDTITFKRDTIKAQIYALGSIEVIQKFMSQNPHFIRSQDGGIDAKLIELIKLQEAANSNEVHCPIDVINIQLKDFSKKYKRFDCD